MKWFESDNFRSILRLAWPAILSNITVPLLGFSDTFISGHLGSERYLAAISAGTIMVNSLFWLFGFLRMGTTGLTATAFGAGDSEEQAAVFSRSLVISLLAGALLIIFSSPLCRLMLAIISAPQDVAASASEYFSILILSSPAILATTAASGRLVGRQNTLYPMCIALTVNVVNIALSMWLVFGLECGFRGVAIGTCVANWLGLVLALWLVARQSGGERWIAPARRLWSGGIGRFFKVNGWLMARSACMLAVTFAMTAFAARIGTLALALNAVMMQFFLLFSYFMDGFAFSAEALCGRYAGAKDFPMLRLSIRNLLIVGGIMSVIFSAAYGLSAPLIASLLTDSRAVVDAVADMPLICWLLPWASVCAFIFDGIFIGLTRTGAMLLSTLIGMLLFFGAYPLLEMTGVITPSNALWSAFLLYLFARGAVLAISLSHKAECISHKYD